MQSAKEDLTKILKFSKAEATEGKRQQLCEKVQNRANLRIRLLCKCLFIRFVRQGSTSRNSLTGKLHISYVEILKSIIQQCYQYRLVTFSQPLVCSRSNARNEIQTCRKRG